MSKKIYLRLGISDITVTKEDSEKMSGYARVYDTEGNLITEAETFFVGYEDEDGEECEEDGTLLEEE